MQKYMQGYTFATCHWLLYPVLFVSCHSCRQNSVLHAHTHTHTQTHTERGTGLCEGTLGSSLLAKTLSSRPLAVQLGKMGVNRRHIVRFGH